MEQSILGLRPGDVIQDTYRVDDILGEGGMGATFRATNLATGHTVAIKVMMPDFARNKRAVEMFRRESSLLRTVRNDAVIGYETTLLDTEGRLFLVMEYVDGKPLAHYLKRGARLSSLDVLKLGHRLAGGLVAIHAHGIVHRDIAPDNILIPNDNVQYAKMIDFGLASNTIGSEQSILGNDFAGKLSYCAPEQLGLFDNKAQKATDVYALGLVLLKTAGLPVPGEGRGFAALDARREDIKVDSSRISPVLARTLEQMLQADPKDRPEDILAVFRAALENESGQIGTSKVKSDRVVSDATGQARTSTKSKRGVLLVLWVGGLLGVIGGGIGAHFAMNQSKPPVGSQVETARTALTATDPLVETVALIKAGGTQNLNAALAALIAYQKDTANPDRSRSRAAILIAQMYDPHSFDPVRSPFPAPNEKAARRYYQIAVDLGSSEAAEALRRLSE